LVTATVVVVYNYIHIHPAKDTGDAFSAFTNNNNNNLFAVISVFSRQCFRLSVIIILLSSLSVSILWLNDNKDDEPLIIIIWYTIIQWNTPYTSVVAVFTNRREYCFHHNIILFLHRFFSCLSRFSADKVENISVGLKSPRSTTAADWRGITTFFRTRSVYAWPAVID